MIVKDGFKDMTKADAMAKLTAWVQQNPETHIGDMTYYFMVGWSGTLYEATGPVSTGFTSGYNLGWRRAFVPELRTDRPETRPRELFGSVARPNSLPIPVISAAPCPAEAAEP